MNSFSRTGIRRLVTRTWLALLVLTIASPFGWSAKPQADRSAFDFMLEAHNARAVWHDFPGFTADIVEKTDSGSYAGTIVVKPDFEYTLTIDDAARESWVKSKLRSVITHRRPSEMSDKGYEFADDTDNGPGVLIAQKDGSGVFRVVDGMIRDVLRKSDTHWFEITNLDQFKTPQGTVLPQVSAVVYRNTATGDIESQRSNVFTWTEVGGYFLPLRTLTVDVGQGGKRSVRELVFSKHQLSKSTGISTAGSKLHKPLRESLTSFGAAVLGDYLYVFSGHNGDAHGFGRDNLSDHFRRIKYDDPSAEWEELARHEPAQSTALVTDGKFLYRIGGLSFLNSGNEETNFNSTTHFARYDPATDEWTELTPLPEPRSSLDAAVLGRSIYVAAGWNLQGESSRTAPWHDDMLRFDLDDPAAGWQSIAGPGYTTRAASLAAHNRKLYLLGGIQERGITRKVSVYDPQSNEWTPGPELKADSSTAGFATSSFATGGNLYYTGASGVVYRLAKDGNEWELVDRLLFPRMFLRLLPLSDDRLIALGGVSGGGRTPSVESLTLSHSEKPTPKLARWSVPFSGRAKHSQTLILDGMKLYAIGGNASPNPHDFSQEAFVKESFVFDISRQSVEQLPDLPQAMQSGAGVVHSQTSEHHAILVFGGLGFRDDEFCALNEVLEFDPDAKTWTYSAKSLPEARSMFSATTHDDAIWLFGGQSVGEDREYQTSILHWWGDSSEITPLPNISVPTPRRSFGGAVLQDKYYMVGGLSQSIGIAERVDVFDFKTREWSEAPSPNVPRVFPSLVATKNKLYLFGGFTRADGHFTPATSLEVFDRETATWSTVAGKIPGVEPGQTMLVLNERLLFYGINTEQQQVDFVLFDPNPKQEPETIVSNGFGGQRRSPDVVASQNAKLMLRKDTNKDGKLSRDELGQRMSQFFDRADTDSDDTLTYDETVAALKANDTDSDSDE